MREDAEEIACKHVDDLVHAMLRNELITEAGDRFEMHRIRRRRVSVETSAKMEIKTIPRCRGLLIISPILLQCICPLA